MDNEVLITAIFVGAGLLSYVIVPGLLVVWDRVLDTWRTQVQEIRTKKSDRQGDSSPATSLLP